MSIWSESQVSLPPSVEVDLLNGLPAIADWVRSAIAATASATDIRFRCIDQGYSRSRHLPWPAGQMETPGGEPVALEGPYRSLPEGVKCLVDSARRSAP